MVGDILQPTHLLFVLVIALLVLGPKRLPEVGRTLGSGIRDFRSAINGESHSESQERVPPAETDDAGSIEHEPVVPPVAPTPTAAANRSHVAEAETTVAVEQAPAADDVPPHLSVSPAAADVAPTAPSESAT